MELSIILLNLLCFTGRDRTSGCLGSGRLCADLGIIIVVVVVVVERVRLGGGGVSFRVIF